MKFVEKKCEITKNDQKKYKTRILSRSKDNLVISHEKNSLAMWKILLIKMQSRELKRKKN